MSRTPEQIEEGNLRRDAQTAQEIMDRADPREQEFECRAAARWLGRDEEAWKDLIPMFQKIQEARLLAIRTRVWSEEEKESWRNYMMNR